MQDRAARLAVSLVAFSDLRTVAYCPRKAYYDRRSEDREPPPSVRRIRSLAYRYERLLDADESTLAEEPLAVPPATFRARLHRARQRLDRWDELVSPADRESLVSGRECRGVVHKVLEGPPIPSLVSAGRPPERGVWEPQAVHAVAAAKALAWRYETAVERAFVEYPAHGVVRRVELTTRRRARYRRALRTLREVDGPPPRTENRSKCESCEYAAECGVRTRTLRSRLGIG